MDVTIAPLQHDQINEFLTIQHEAFADPTADMIMPMIFPQGLQPDLLAWLRQRMLARTHNRPQDSCFVAMEKGTGEMVRISWWETERQPPRPGAEVDHAWSKSLASRQQLPAVAGMNTALEAALGRAALYTCAKQAQGAPYTELRVLAVRPDHHRRRIGAKLLQHGLARVDQQGLPALVIAGTAPRVLYARHGFELVSEFPLDCRDYGGKSEAQHWVMLRRPRERVSADNQ